MPTRRHITDRYGSPRYTSIDQVPSKDSSGPFATLRPRSDRKERYNDAWAANDWKADRYQWGGNRYNEPFVTVARDSRLHAMNRIPQYDQMGDVSQNNRRDSGWGDYQTRSRDAVMIADRGESYQDTAEHNGKRGRQKMTSRPEDWTAPRPSQPNLNIAPTTDPFDDKYDVVHEWVTSVSSQAPEEQKWSGSRHDSFFEGIQMLNLRDNDATTIQWGKMNGISKQSAIQIQPQEAEIEHLRQQLAEEKQKNADLGRRLFTLENEAVDPGTEYAAIVNEELDVAPADLIWEEEFWDTASIQSSGAIFGQSSHDWGTEISPSNRQGNTRLHKAQATWSIPYPTITPESRRQRSSRIDEIGINSIHRWGDNEERHTAILRDGVHGTKPLFITFKKRATFGDILQGRGRRRDLPIDWLYLRVLPDGSRVLRDQTVAGVGLEHLELEVRDFYADGGW